MPESQLVEALEHTYLASDFRDNLQFVEAMQAVRVSFEQISA